MDEFASRMMSALLNYWYSKEYLTTGCGSDFGGDNWKVGFLYISGNIRLLSVFRPMAVPHTILAKDAGKVIMTLIRFIVVGF